MPYEIRLEQFSGPLDLLLQLIENEEFDITQISLAQVTEQYIRYLEQVEQFYPEELADFLVVATKLLLIKSRTLLPYLQPEEEEETNLESQLKIYREYLEAAKTIEAIIKKRNWAYDREELHFRSSEIIFSPAKNITSLSLRQIFSDVLTGLEPIVRLPRAAIAKAITLKEKLNDLQARIAQEVKINFMKLIQESKSKTEVILNFLAVLELIKQEMVVVHQKKHFGEIEIIKI